jgi:hypothetical protein
LEIHDDVEAFQKIVAQEVDLEAGGVSGVEEPGGYVCEVGTVDVE